MAVERTCDFSRLKAGGDRDYGISLLDLESRKATRLVDLPGSAHTVARCRPTGGGWRMLERDRPLRVRLEPFPRSGARFN